MSKRKKKVICDGLGDGEKEQVRKNNETERQINV